MGGELRRVLEVSTSRRHVAMYATGLVDLEQPILIDLVKGSAAADLRGWCANADSARLAGIEVGRNATWLVGVKLPR